MNVSGAWFARCAALFVALPLAMAACSTATVPPGDAPGDAAAPEGADPAVGEPSGEGEAAATFSPGELQLCDEVSNEIAAKLGVDVSLFSTGGADWVDMADGSPRQGCQITYEGLGEELGVGPSSYLAPGHAIRSVLSDRGWTESDAHAADGPGATVFGYLGEDELCVASVSFAPPEGSDCPESDPVTCGLPPAEHRYKIDLTCATVPAEEGQEE
jgi:hypothetical protein